MPDAMVVVVTGANRGIGLGICELLLKRYHPLTLYATSRAGKSFGLQEPDSESTIHYCKLDVTDKSSIQSLAEEIKRKYGHLDVLINNAGVNTNPDKSSKATALTLDTNYRGTLHMCQAFIPLLSSSGRIVNVTSGASSLHPYSSEIKSKFRSSKLTLDELEDMAKDYQDGIDKGDEADRGWGNEKQPYCMSKACVNAITAVLARQQKGLVINACCPGWVDTDMGKQMGQASKTIADGAKIPVRLGMEDIGEVTGKYWANHGVNNKGDGQVMDCVKASSMLQNVLWKLNGFEKLRTITQLDTYEPRYDPTVVPVKFNNNDDKSGSVDDLACPASRLNSRRHYTIGDYHDAFTSQRLTPLEVIDTILPLITPNNRSSRHAVAFIQIQAEHLRIAAKKSSERHKSGQPLSILDGVPVAVKDEIDLAGYSKCLGSKNDFTNSLDQTGWCIQKLEEAGALVIGKTNMHEVGLDTSGNNPTTGTPLNPHNEAYYCGGSSSGSAMAIAAGICPIAHGADGGGSIRLPSGFCGLYGLKPSHGRVSGRPTKSLAPTVGVDGPMASDLGSLEIAYRIMAQPDPEHTSSRIFPSPLTQILPSNPSSSTTPKRIPIGIYHDWINRSDPVVHEMFKEALTYYSKNPNYEIINDITLPFLPESQKAHALTILNEVHSGLTQTQLNQLSYPNQLLLTVAGTNATTQDFMAAQKLRNLMMKHLSWLWDRYPGMLILTPTTPCAGWKIKDFDADVGVGSYGVSDGDMTVRSMEYVFLANWTGCPALTRPMGYTDEGVPVGLMAMSEWGSEDSLFTWAADGEGLIEGGTRRPSSDGAWVDVIEHAETLRA